MLLLGFATAATVACTAYAEDRVPAPQSLVSQRFTATTLGPLHASLTLIDGRLLRVGRRHIALELSNRSEAPVAGSFRVANTAAWEIAPATHFSFELEAGEALLQDFEVWLPMYVSPGRYEFAVRVALAGRDVGAVRAHLLKPLDWLVIAPFAPPEASAALPPELGVNLDGSHQGIDGRIGWRAVPDFAFDGEGRLELDLIYGPPVSPRCACAFTVFEAVHGEALRWRGEGADVVQLNGRVLLPGEAARVHKGRNTLLVRSCDRAGVWRLGVTLLGSDGGWVRGIDNDLAALLDGFEALRRDHGAQGAAGRQVLLEYYNPNADVVEVLGSFNGWVPLSLKRDGAGTWKRDLLLAPGRYAYKLSVDGHLYVDPSAPRTEPDGFGGQNSVLIIR